MNESICPIFSENTFITPDIEAYRFVDSKYLQEIAIVPSYKCSIVGLEVIRS